MIMIHDTDEIGWKRHYVFMLYKKNEARESLWILGASPQLEHWSEGAMDLKGYGNNVSAFTASYSITPTLHYSIQKVHL
jgi:hypothetical protein